jgi:hypothetical protein
MPARQTRKQINKTVPKARSYRSVKKELPTFLKLDVGRAAIKKQGTPVILVPYRDNPAKERSDQLKEFVEHFSKGSWKELPVMLIEQSDDDRLFNRGALLNVGARLAKKHTHIILHDIDLLPDESLLPYYTMIPDHPIHIGTVWRTKYTSERFLGGILSISLKDFQRVNGYPNQFWGWGGEDDVLRNRLIHKKIPVYRPTIQGGITELPHIHVGSNPALVNPKKREMVLSNRGKDGVRQTEWTLLHKESLASHIDKYTVKLNS